MVNTYGGLEGRIFNGDTKSKVGIGGGLDPISGESVKILSRRQMRYKDMTGQWTYAITVGELKHGVSKERQRNNGDGLTILTVSISPYTRVTRRCLDSAICACWRALSFGPPFLPPSLDQKDAEGRLALVEL